LLVVILVMLGTIIFLLVRGQKATILAAAGPAVRIQMPAMPPEDPLPNKPLPAPVEAAKTPIPPAPLASVEAPSAPTPPAATKDAVKSGSGEKAAYTAVEGDTLSNVAAGLLGSDSKKNRQAVQAANPPLQADPDRVLAGQTYHLAAPAASSLAASSPTVPSSSTPAAQSQATAHPGSDRVLKYTAQPGDSVSALAAGLLGGDSKTNRDAIISNNQSLQNDPDHLVAGKTYKIPAGEGLSSAPVSGAPARPATQPADADEVVQIEQDRELRYTARAGDTVSKLAEVLLGSDTRAHRDAIINNNVSLKADPDRVIAGQTYWIPAPTAVVK